ncbi:unnamed protein product [Phytomonas sp. EM1]|nr:unnamed protein product [Phytomonas sp. EM1]|eukprot:CCW65179.1 unnamed protein product [Phytomonas sp. isolate EM1]
MVYFQVNHHFLRKAKWVLVFGNRPSRQFLFLCIYKAVEEI